MKRHCLWTEILIFSLFFAFFLIPPIVFQFNQNNIVFSKWSFNPSVLISLFLSIFAIIFYYEKKIYKNILVQIILPGTFIFCILFFFSLIFKFISEILPSSNFNNEINVILPENIKEWCFCLLQFFIGAVYEEVFYRFYLPEMILIWLNDKCEKIEFSEKKYKISKIIIEVCIMLIFGFSHLYMGIISVINACIAHGILRLSFKKLKSLSPGIIAHFSYNIISLILL